MVQRDRAESLFLIGVLLLLLYLSFLIFEPFLEWVILGFLFAYLFNRPYQWTLKWVGRRSIAAGLMMTLILLLFFVPVVIIAAILARDVRSLVGGLQGTDWDTLLVDTLQAIASFFGVHVEQGTLTNAAETISRSAQDYAVGLLESFASNLPTILVTLLVGLFIFGFVVYYGFVDGDRIVRGTLSLIPLRPYEKERLFNEVRVVTDAVFVGHIMVSAIQAVLGTIGFLLLGVPRAFFWGFVMLIVAIIPVLGVFLVWAPVGLYLLFAKPSINGLFSDDPVFAAFGVLFFVGPLISLIDNILRPKLVGSRADIHPLLVLIGALGGIFVFGFTGFVVGPLVLSLLVASARVYREHWKGEHVTPEKAAVVKVPEKRPDVPKAARKKA